MRQEPVLLECGKTRVRGVCLWAGRVGTDDLFVQLLRVDDVALSLFELGGLKQFLRLVPTASRKNDTECNSPYVDPLSNPNIPSHSHSIDHWGWISSGEKLSCQGRLFYAKTL